MQVISRFPYTVEKDKENFKLILEYLDGSVICKKFYSLTKDQLNSISTKAVWENSETPALYLIGTVENTQKEILIVNSGKLTISNLTKENWIKI